MTTDHAALVQRIVMVPMTTLYRAPSHIEGKDQARLYLNQLVQAIASMRPEEFELEEAWARVVREHKTSVWPTPAVICGALTEYRERVARVNQQARLAEPPKPIEEDINAYDPVAEAEALRRVDVLAKQDPDLARFLRNMHAGFEKRAQRRGRAA